MNKPFIEIDAENFTLSAFETKPIEGYELPINKETGEQFPNCCSFHKSVFEVAEKWFEEFPHCCERHKKFIGMWGFNKENYNGIVEKIVKQLSYTEYHITERIKEPDWYKDITDYIDYNYSSFGHPAVGVELYLRDVKHFIQNTKVELSKEQRQRLSEFIEGYYKPSETAKTDLNILYLTYQKWLKEFPFELKSYFGNLKQRFEKQLPILKGEPETNIYSGMAKAKMHTKSSLIEALINLTKELLSIINVREMVEKGIISDLNKHRFELESESLRIATSQITKEFSKGELQYIKALKKWLNLHKEYFKEITPLMKASPHQPTETKEEQETIELKPVLKPEAVQIVFETIKDFFNPEQQTELRQIIETGNKTSKKLLFKGNGNRLTDTFKKLIEHDFITGCQKRDLINWIISNFTFIQKYKAKVFVYDTVEKIISRKDYPCKSPLIEIKNGQIKRVEQPRTKKYR